MHFYEASIITTKDGLQCQVYSNEHPSEGILVKPKYIPTEKIESTVLQYRFIAGKKMNRLDLWSDAKELKKYIEEFKKNYPKYVYKSPLHEGNRLFFIVPFDEIERVYFPRKGLSELMNMPLHALDEHLSNVREFTEFLAQSGVKMKDFGVTYSTLMGHYSHKSDINIVVYGKENYWNVINHLKSAKHPKLRWKTEQEWLDFHKKRNRYKIFEEQKFLQLMKNKRSEGFFNGVLFVLFCVEKAHDTWFRWGSEWYKEVGKAIIEGTVKDNMSAVVRPGYYEIEKSKIIEGHEDVPVKKIVFYTRDYCDLAQPGERLRASGILEKVDPRDGKESYFRLVVGYLDAYINDRRDKEYIKVV